MVMAAVTATRNGVNPTTVISIPTIEVRHVDLKIIGDSSLIVHRWSDKAKSMMLAKQRKEATQTKAAKDPEQDFRDSLYHCPDGAYGFPAVGFKAAAVSACRFADIKMTEARGAFHVDGEMVRIDGEPTMREDMVRVGMGVADIRYRGEFLAWSAVIPISYNAAAMSVAQIVNLFNLAGFGVGIGEWRPDRDGPYGRFHVATDGDRT